MTDSIREDSALPSLEKLPPLPDSDSSSDGSDDSKTSSVESNPLPWPLVPPPELFERLAVVDFALDTKEKAVIATEEDELPRKLGEHKVRIYFAHGFKTLNALKIQQSVMGKLLPRVARKGEKY
jgi:hypothetical protein